LLIKIFVEMKLSSLKFKIKNPERILLSLGLLVICFMSCKFVYEILNLAKTQKEIGEGQLPQKLDLQILQKTLSLLNTRLDLTRELSPANLENKERVLTVSIINGSGVEGAAARIKVNLEAKGFSVPSISTNPSLLKETSILVKPEVEKVKVDLIKKVLGEEFSVINEDTLAEDYSVDISIILGK